MEELYLQDDYRDRWYEDEAMLFQITDLDLRMYVEESMGLTDISSNGAYLDMLEDYRDIVRIKTMKERLLVINREVTNDRNVDKNALVTEAYCIKESLRQLGVIA
jgi:hypothetical protein